MTGLDGAEEMWLPDKPSKLKDKEIFEQNQLNTGTDKVKNPSADDLAAMKMFCHNAAGKFNDAFMLGQDETGQAHQAPIDFLKASQVGTKHGAKSARSADDDEEEDTGADDDDDDQLDFVKDKGKATEEESLVEARLKVFGETCKDLRELQNTHHGSRVAAYATGCHAKGAGRRNRA